MPMYFAGLTSSVLVDSRIKDVILQLIKQFEMITFPELTDIEIGNIYFLLWQSENLFISYDPSRMHGHAFREVKLPNPLTDGSCKFVVPHHQKERISILSTNNILWEYDIDTDICVKISTFTPRSGEHAVKIIHCRYNMLLTNLGRLLNMHDEQEIRKDNVKFIDIASAVQYVVMLGDNFHVYVSTVRMRQDDNMVLDCIVGLDLIPVLSERKIIQIAAGAMHIAAITEEGHLYTWGCNISGELGIGYRGDVKNIPQLVAFQHDNTYIEVKVIKVQCGNNFTVCLTDDGTLWGTGDNSCCQLGHYSGITLNYLSRFTELQMEPLCGRTVIDFKCNENGTAIITE